MACLRFSTVLAGSIALMLAGACSAEHERGSGGRDAGPRPDSGGGGDDGGGGGTEGGGGGTDGGGGGTDGGGVDGGRVFGDSGPCPEFSMSCGGRCIDTRTDPRNCGGCGRSCSITRDCVDGTCVEGCGEGLARCGTECVDITSDTANCGACGRACAPTESCTVGRCEPCPAGLSECAPMMCFDLRSDEMNCGMCGMACPAEENCSGGVCRRGLSGMTGMTWELVPSGMGHGFQEFVPAGEQYVYLGSGTTFTRLDWMAGTWETLASAPGAGFGYWGGPTLADGLIWGIRNDIVFSFDPGSLAWTTPRSDLHAGGDDQSMNTTDRDGNVWSYNGMDELVKYNPTTDTVTYYRSGVTFDTFETRLVYDGLTHSIYFGGFAQAILARFDIDTEVVTMMTPHPEGALNDVTCSDHNGHIYAAGGFSGMTVWQLDTEMNTWSMIPDYPMDHGNNGTCAVVEDGWLYLEPGDTSTVYRLQLF